MELSQQVCSLELSKRLKELGVKQEAIIHWIESPHIMQYSEVTQRHECIETRTELSTGWYLPQDIIGDWAAFTVAELVAILPLYLELIIDEDKEGYGIFRPKLWCGRCDFDGNDQYSWLVYYGNNHATYEKTLADACAKMLIHLYEQGLMK